MEKDFSKSAKSDLAYIRAVMVKAEVGLRQMKGFFLFLAMYFFVCGLLRACLWHTFDKMLSPVSAWDMFARSMYECGWRAFEAVPPVVVALVLRGRVKGQELGRWLLGVTAFTVAFCNGVLPITVTAVSASHEAADIFSVVTIALLALICGVFTDNRGLKVFAVVYAFLAMLVLTVLGFAHLFWQFRQEVYSLIEPHRFLVTALYVRSFLTTVYPAMGCAAIAAFLWVREKEKISKEMV